jgi:hypothetical protein
VSHEVESREGLSRAWYGASLDDFRKHDADFIIGRLSRHSTFDVVRAQTEAWLEEIAILRGALHKLDGFVLFEFAIPRMGLRADVILLIGPVIFVLEFKTGASRFDPAAVEQVWDYALDLKNFHAASHHLRIVPLLVATAAKEGPAVTQRVDDDGVYRPISVTTRSLRTAIDSVLEYAEGPLMDARQWLASPYRPTPTIIEAARALYAEHSVEAIARHDAGAENLHVTSKRLEDIIEQARLQHEKIICFVTGVPGAGKTLVGLNVATQRRQAASGEHAVYLSGNEPLVKVLRAALARDEYVKRRSRNEHVRKGVIGEAVKAFIQNVHHFRDEAVINHAPPAERVAVFDEAQRAWTTKKTADFMSRKKGVPGFNQSEPEFLLGTMDRHRDWSVVICLVGGGQEINQGEAGIEAWFDAIRSRFPEWHVYISSRLVDGEYAADRGITAIRNRGNLTFDDSLHLSVSMRSFRAEFVSNFVKAVLDLDRTDASSLAARLVERYPIRITRDLNKAKAWLRDRARGSERYGLLASSKAQRLKPHAVDIRVEIDPVHWFLDDKYDTRSSFYMEDAATEFQVQGLEIDWACVTWDADLRLDHSRWSYHDFRGSGWTNVNNEFNRRYLLNAYRVLLTRARQGMVIFVPPGERSDPTRPPEFYDGIANYLADLGVEQLT